MNLILVLSTKGPAEPSFFLHLKHSPSSISLAAMPEIPELDSNADHNVDILTDSEEVSYTVP